MWKKDLDNILITIVYARSFCINLLYFLFGYCQFQLLRKPIIYGPTKYGDQSKVLFLNKSKTITSVK